MDSPRQSRSPDSGRKESGNNLCTAALFTAFNQEWIMTAFHAARLATDLLVAGVVATFAAVVGVI